MCGIVGVADLNGLPGDMEARMRKAMDLQSHRGPDANGLAQYPWAQLGHLRLSIIDLSGGAQPMYSEDGRFCIVFNGEVYNFAEVKAELEKKGVRFRTHSDTEVLLYAYREWGRECLHRFNGMFAFAIADTQKREIFLARDRLGKKPLYYAQEGGRLIFASELKGILPLLARTPDLDHAALDCYLANRYVIAPRTMMAGVSKLPPGWCALWKDGRLQASEYWDIPTGPEPAKVDAVEAGQRLHDLLLDAVRLRMIADVPLGVFLSGGLDSTIITQLMHEIKGGGIKTFAIASSGGGKWDERKFARLAAERYQTDHHEMEVDPSGFLDSMAKMAWDMDDLVADPASILLYHVSKLARTKVTVALSGEGSDELFAGYSYFKDVEAWERQKRFNSLPAPAAALARTLAGVNPSLVRYLALYRKPMKDFALLVQDFYGLGMEPAFRRRLMAPEHASRYGALNSEYVRDIHSASKAEDIVSHQLYVDAKGWLPDNLLTKADRMSMATSLELRVPFLDYRLVEFCFRLPTGLKIRRRGNDWETKALLRDVFRGKVPDEIMDRSKQGFPSNFLGILTTDQGKAFMKEAVSSSTARKLLDEKAVMAEIDRASPADRKHCQYLFSLVLFCLWHGKYLGRA